MRPAAEQHLLAAVCCTLVVLVGVLIVDSRQHRLHARDQRSPRLCAVVGWESVPAENIQGDQQQHHATPCQPHAQTTPHN
jgi:hypothetical protein